MFFLLFSCYGPQASDLLTEVYSLKLDGSGDGTLKLRVPDNVSSFIATAQSPERVSLESIVGPGSETVLRASDWSEGPKNLSNGLLAYFTDATVQWPIRGLDGEPSKGVWRLNWSSPKAAKERIDVTVTTGVDQDWTDGYLDVAICYGDSIGSQLEVTNAIEEAFNYWEELYDAQNIRLKRHSCSGDFSQDLSIFQPLEELSSYRADFPDGTVILLVGEQIDMSLFQLGFSGSVPGILSAHPRGYVGLSWLSHAGSDGVFSSQEIQIFGETMGHEVGHYLGAFHPVELDFLETDALSDTPTCSSTAECSEIFENHLMHASPVCTLFSCSPQYDVSPQQQETFHRYTGVH